MLVERKVSFMNINFNITLVRVCPIKYGFVVIFNDTQNLYRMMVIAAAAFARFVR